MTPPLSIFARPSLTVKFGGMAWVLVFAVVDEAFSWVEVDVGLGVLVGALSWVEVEVEGATRVEESLMAMLGEVDVG